MGEVYRARDAKLNRDVAIKVLLPAVANDPDRLARFSREAQVLASLNHPNIAAIYGVEESPAEAGRHLGTDVASGFLTTEASAKAVSRTIALVMELVEGEDLSQRIAGGPIPLDEALPIAKQIAEALEAAHEQGIIHRDLKPANIKVRADGTVKVLDFGLAKAVDPTSGSSAIAMNSPTLSIHATQAGIILGTAAYMSPEQARGKRIDRRTDIWSLGCVLFEMLAGTRPFQGDDATDTIVAVVSQDPDWRALPSSVPASIRQLLRRSLEKDPKRRLDSAAAVRLEIDHALSGSPDDRQSAATHSSRLLPWAVAAAAIVVAAVSLLAWRRSPVPASAPATHLILSEQVPASLDGGGRSFAIAPDGRRIVYLANATGTPQLFLRDLGSGQSTPIPGTEFATSPFFSPDGQRLGFFAQQKLQVLTLAGGLPVPVTDVVVPRGGTWLPDDTIVYSPATDAGLWRVPVAGGTPQVLAQPDPAKGERSFRWPEALPHGNAVIFTVATSEILSFDDARVVVLSLGTGEQHDVVRGGRAVYSTTGDVVYSRAGALLAVPFDETRWRVTGESRVVVPDVVTYPHSGGSQYALSATGTLLYLAGKPESSKSTLSWVSRSGVASALALPPAAYQQVSMSPDGRRAAIDIDGANASIWVLDLERTILTRLTLEWSNNNPSWTSDANQVAFTSARAGNRGLFWQRVDNQAGQEAVFPRGEFGGQVGFSTWLRDGKTVIFDAASPRTGSDLWAVQLDGARVPKPLLKTAFGEWHPSVSPDGRWLAYVSDESGREEIYLQPYPGPGGKTRISSDGGTGPMWGPDSRELFFLDGDRMMAVAVDAASGPSGRSRLLFQRPGASSSYGVGRDGNFLMIDAGPSTSESRPITIVLNWFEELKAVAK